MPQPGAGFVGLAAGRFEIRDGTAKLPKIFPGRINLGEGEAERANPFETDRAVAVADHAHRGVERGEAAQQPTLFAAARKLIGPGNVDDALQDPSLAFVDRCPFKVQRGAAAADVAGADKVLPVEDPDVGEDIAFRWDRAIVVVAPGTHRARRADHNSLVEDKN